MVAFEADKVDFLYICMKFVSESLIFNNMWKACGTPKELKGPPEGRGPPVEKHCSR
jgi:hypothetical protein